MNSMPGRLLDYAKAWTKGNPKIAGGVDQD
jgi:hypothetical protein